jgi:hypothetical protein
MPGKSATSAIHTRRQGSLRSDSAPRYGVFDRDPRPVFAYALHCAFRRYQWLYDVAGWKDFKQQVSMACCGQSTETRGDRYRLSRAVDRACYAMARDWGFCRPSAGLRRGRTGHWKLVADELVDRYFQGEEKCNTLSADGPSIMAC